jgi:hypothetical protein
MDDVVPSDSGRTRGDWMKALSEPFADVARRVIHRIVPPAVAPETKEEAREVVPSVGKTAEPSVESTALVPLPVEKDDPAEAAAVTSERLVADHAEDVAQAPASGSDLQAAVDDAFFAEEADPAVPNRPWFAPDPSGRVPSVEVPAVEVAPIAPSVEHPQHDQASDRVVGFASGKDRALEAEPEVDAYRFAVKDPALVEPPAVHVTPEPLLVDDEPSGPSEYGTRAEETPALDSFTVQPVEDSGVKEPVAQKSLASGDPTAPSSEPARRETDQRIPTGPPPNREALTAIPFLTPPPGFRADATEAAAANSETVDAVVRKVLEKLEPQLHELLSRGVLKPLVENLLQSELAKKEK